MKISEKTSLRLRQAKLVLELLIGITIAAVFGWELFKTGDIGQQPVEVRAGFLGFCLLVALVALLQRRTPDKTGLKRQWWR